MSVATRMPADLLSGAEIAKISGYSIEEIEAIIRDFGLPIYNDAGLEKFSLSDWNKAKSNLEAAMPQDLLRVKDLAQLTGKAEVTIWSYLQKGKLTRYHKDGVQQVSLAEWNQVSEGVKMGRPRGTSLIQSDRRELIETRTNRKTGTDYRLYRDPDTEPHYWLHCVEHGLQIAVDTQREAIAMLAKPETWCDKCQTKMQGD